MQQRPSNPSTTSKERALWVRALRENDRGRPVEFNEAQLRALLTEDPRQTTQELAVELGCVHSIVAEHLKKMQMVQKAGSWVPHLLIQANKEFKNGCVPFSSCSSCRC
uniref:PH domain-containing protein n=1 Tax=Ditylenchus dipsaci TaxID=166011 RepID=A0A915E3K2_9BILA